MTVSALAEDYAAHLERWLGDGREGTLQAAGELRVDTGPGRGTDLVIVIPTEE